jgi:hypothetical protein
VGASYTKGVDMKSNDKAPASESESELELELGFGFEPKLTRKLNLKPAPETDHSAFNSLIDCIDMGCPISVLATAIENDGIYGWDRFGRFIKFSKNVSKGDDAVIYHNVLDALARQYAWQWDARLQQSEKSPIELTAYPGPLCFGWYEDEMPDLSAIIAGGLAQPGMPSLREENNDKVLIGVLKAILIEKGVFKSQAALITYLIDERYNEYPGFAESTLEAKFAKANSLLLPPNLR